MNRLEAAVAELVDRGACGLAPYVTAGDGGLSRTLDVLHALEVAGPRHVALGADFDGIARRPAGLEDASGYPALLEVLARRGVDQETLGFVAYHNAARAIAEATATAAAR